MISVNFVCLGNICRSPMAELIFKDMVNGEGLASFFVIDSSGTSDYEIGNPIYPPAQKILAEHGIHGEHTARQLTLKDIKNNDYVLVMDSENLVDVLRLTGGRYGDKIFKLCSFTDNPRDIADPWYTHDFRQAYKDIKDGCKAFFAYLKRERPGAIGFAGQN